MGEELELACLAPPTPTPTPTMTSTPTPFPTGPAMSLRVGFSQQTDCGDPVAGKVCVPVGAKFDVIAVTDVIPAQGYVLAQVWIDYDSQGLVHKNGTVALWFDCEGATYLASEDVGNNGASAGCLTGIVPPLPPSFYLGDLYSFSLTCTDEVSSSVIRLLPAGTDPAGTSGALYIDADGTQRVPAVGDRDPAGEIAGAR